MKKKKFKFLTEKILNFLEQKKMNDFLKELKSKNKEF